MTVYVGDPAPTFYAREASNPRYAFDTAAGRNLVLTFLRKDADHLQMVRNLAASPLFDDTRAALFIVTPGGDSIAKADLPLRIPGVRAFFDDDGNLMEKFGLARYPNGLVSFVISPRLQVLAIVATPPDSHAQNLIGLLQQIPAAQALPPILSHPPVLVIPHVFEPALCADLITGYRSNGGRLSGFMRDIDGRTVEVQDASHKVRRDWTIEDDQTELKAALQTLFLRRVVPEIRKAFHFDVTRMERYLVARYGAEDGGHFRPHRDNTTKGTAHRRFAVTLNLNADAYDGGDLRFPEFGMQTYRAPTGGAVVFSCSLLHEATRITRGERFAFLPFLYDEAARKQREANFQYLGDVTVN